MAAAVMEQAGTIRRRVRETEARRGNAERELRELDSQLSSDRRDLGALEVWLQTHGHPIAPDLSRVAAGSTESGR